VTDVLFDLHPDFSARQWRVRFVSAETITHWVIEWHYAHRYPSPGPVGYGVFAPDMVALVVTTLGANAHGVAAKYGLASDVGNLEIARVVAHPDAPKNAASRAIASCYSTWRAQGYHWLFSYADTGQGHHGGIYQALNAVYVGLSAARPGYLADGREVHPRSLVSRYGTQAWPRVQELAAADGVALVKVPGLNTAKHTYILPVGTPSERRAIRRHLARHAKPYPKRDAAVAA
jgi:hypothetical protein